MLASEIVALRDGAGWGSGIAPTERDYAPPDDKFYALVSQDWMDGAFSKFLWELYRQLGMEKPDPDINDCDDYADECIRAVKRANNVWSERLSSVAIGSVDYLAIGRDIFPAPHRTVWYIDKVNGIHVNKFYNAMPPQPLTTITLLPEEIASIRGARI